MRNWLAMGVVALCLGLLTCDTSMALGGNSGGGKASTKGRFLVANDGPNAVRVLIQPAGTALPATLGGIQANSFVVEPGSTDVGPRRDSGSFDIYVVDSVFFNMGIAGGVGTPSGTPDDSRLGLALSGSDVSVTVSSSGFAAIDAVTR